MSWLSCKTALVLHVYVLIILVYCTPPYLGRNVFSVYVVCQCVGGSSHVKQRPPRWITVFHCVIRTRVGKPDNYCVLSWNSVFWDHQSRSDWIWQNPILQYLWAEITGTALQAVYVPQHPHPCMDRRGLTRRERRIMCLSLSESFSPPCLSFFSPLSLWKVSWRR